MGPSLPLQCRHHDCATGSDIRVSPVLLKAALISPAHSLVDQRLHSRLGAEATNEDGFGIGWYDEQPEPGLFNRIELAWSAQISPWSRSSPSST
jgi:predicted glutamine amidotransferase